MDKFTVEAGIPIPAKAYSKPPVYPLEEMDIEDSFFVPEGRYTVVGATVRKWATKNGKLFTIRKVEGGIRVWRVA